MITFDELFEKSVNKEIREKLIKPCEDLTYEDFRKVVEKEFSYTYTSFEFYTICLYLSANKRNDICYIHKEEKFIQLCKYYFSEDTLKKAMNTYKSIKKYHKINVFNS
jgi:hypothetical protein